MFPEWMCWRMLHVFSVVKSNLLMFQSTCSWFLIHSFPQNLCKVNKLPCASFIRVFVKTTIKLQIQVMCELWGKHLQALDNKQDFEITKENMGLKQQDILNTDRLRLKNMNASILTISNSWCPATNTSVFGFDSNAKFAKLSSYYTLVARHHWIVMAPITVIIRHPSSSS